MALYVMPAFFALFLWWFSTGLVLYVVGRPRATHANAMIVTTLLLFVGLWGIWSSADVTSLSGAYVAFAAALLVWGWHEMAFLLGYITGPRTTAEIKSADARAPLGAAVEAVIYHEFAIALTAALIRDFNSRRGQPNRRLDFYYLVAGPAEHQAKYLFGRSQSHRAVLARTSQIYRDVLLPAAMNVLFPITVTVTTIITALLIASAAQPDALPFEIASYVFLATLMALAVLEHWFLVLPIPSAELWTWGLASREPTERNRTGHLETSTQRVAVPGANA